ncbi:MAG: four helix bundle protein [Actinobacteria bacterium]|nr:four helix bundle protein [Actinomycetota bacterium]
MRRSSKSIVCNLVEGFARRNYKNKFLRYITYYIGECDGTQVHLQMLFETGSLKVRSNLTISAKNTTN